MAVLDQDQKRAAVDGAVGKITWRNHDWTVPLEKDPEGSASGAQLCVKSFTPRRRK